MRPWPQAEICLQWFTATYSTLLPSQFHWRWEFSRGISIRPQQCTAWHTTMGPMQRVPVSPSNGIHSSMASGVSDKAHKAGVI